MTLADRIYRLINRAGDLHDDAPWIYSDAWLQRFMQEIATIVDENDERLADWEKEWHLND